MRPIRFPYVLIVPAFLASTAFFLWQHTTGVGWDFAAYSLNARYWFQGGAIGAATPRLIRPNSRASWRKAIQPSRHCRV